MPSKRPPKQDLTSIQSDYIKTFTAPEGQRVLLHLADQCGITKYDANASYEAMLLHKGAQRMIFSIFAILNTDPKILLERMEKNQTRKYVNEDDYVSD